MNANTLISSRESGGTHRVFIGDYAGNVVRFDDSTRSDLGSAYDVHWRTTDHDHGQSGLVKGVGDCHIAIGPGATYTPTLSFFFNYSTSSSTPQNIAMPNEGAQWGTMVWGSDVWAAKNEVAQSKIYGFGGGTTVAFDFFHNGINQPFFVTNFEAQLRTIGETQGVAAG